MTAGEYCSREVVVARKNLSIIEAARLMRDNHVGDVVVVEQAGDLLIPVGILTDRDIVVGVMAKEADYLKSLMVGDVMSEVVMTAMESDDLTDVLKGMCSHGIRRIPVVNGRGGLEGILSVDDIIEQICEELSDIAKLIAIQRKREEETRG